MAARAHDNSFVITQGNRLLAALPPEDFARVQPHLAPVTLKKEQTLVTPGEPMRYAYFPLDGVISLLILLEDGTSVEVANIGNEGFADATCLLSIDQSPYVVEAQGTVHAWRIPVRPLRELFR